MSGIQGQADDRWPAAGFAVDLLPDGYAWWYVDATSDDGRHGLTLIAFVGSVFSPFYARARRRGPASPYEHCAFNLALYGNRTARWVMTERPLSALDLSSTRYALGPNQLSWAGGKLHAGIDDLSAPLPRRVCGELEITPQPLIDCTFALDRDGTHLWRPLAPRARIEVAMTRPPLRWSGRAYVDSNLGMRPLEHDFLHWNWCRSTEADGTSLLYDVTPRVGEARQLALHVTADGQVQQRDPPPRVTLPCTRIWRVRRQTQSESGAAAVVRTLEDTPFYARSIVATRLGAKCVEAVHESVSLQRFRRRWIQALLGFRMLRRWS